MQVDFFATPCTNRAGNCKNEPIHCLQVIRHNSFGINDVNGGNGLPAKINALQPNPFTDFIVLNNSATPITFKSVDWCVEIYRTGNYSLDDENRNCVDFSSDNIDSNGQGLIKRCEGFLQFNGMITFVEIKNRQSGRGGWLKDAREKFEETILSFKEHHPALVGQIVKPIVCNPSYRGPHPDETKEKKRLKEKIGVDFIYKNEITI